MKKTCKRLLVSLMATVMLFSLAACSGSSNQPASGGTPASTSPDGATLDFPKQDITLIVPYAAGGTTDLLARALTTQLSDDLGVNVIVQNVEGGGGTTGTSQAVNSKADGYTLAILELPDAIPRWEREDEGDDDDRLTPLSSPNWQRKG